MPLTILRVQPNFITQIKTKARDGYDALQVSTLETRRAKKPQQGHFKKAGMKKSFKISRELRLQDADTDLKVGQEISLDNFQPGDSVEVVGTSKGKGFAGGIKRHNFSSRPKSHGGKGNVRKIGAIGSIFPQKVVKGKKMPGRMGGRRTTIKGLKIGLVDEKKRVVGIRGAVPGPRRSLVMIRKVSS